MGTISTLGAQIFPAGPYCLISVIAVYKDTHRLGEAGQRRCGGWGALTNLFFFELCVFGVLFNNGRKFDRLPP